MTSFLQLGASLYVPGTHSDLSVIASGEKYPFLRSVVFCTEDSIRAEEVPEALECLRQMLAGLSLISGPDKPASASPLLFIRPRNPGVLGCLLKMKGIERISGFVLPKVTRGNIDRYFAHFRADDAFLVMPTLETVEVFDAAEMSALRQQLIEPRYRRRILGLRIGGNDLLSLLGVRRSAGGTIYDTPLAGTISQLVTQWRPHGFGLTGPVFERLEDEEGLVRETERDLAWGLFGKTAIHPRQVPVIQAQYRVSREDWLFAERLLQEGPAVYRFQDTMCEPSTQRGWARQIHERALLYGIGDVPDVEKEPRSEDRVHFRGVVPRGPGSRRGNPG